MLCITLKGGLFGFVLLFTVVYDKHQVFSVSSKLPHPGLHKVEVTSLEEWLERNFPK